MYNQAVQQTGAAQQRWRALGVLLGLALLLQLAGLVAPGWYVMSVGSAFTHIGLWFIVSCVDDNNCETRSTSGHAGFLMTKSELREYRAEACTALICCIIAIILAQRSRATPSPTHMYGATAVFAVISGILALVPSGKVLDTTLDVNKAARDLGFDKPYDPPYALILTLVGGCLACLAAPVAGWYMFRPTPALPTVVTQPQVLNMPQYVTTMPGPTNSATASAPPDYVVPAGGYAKSPQYGPPDYGAPVTY